MNEENHTEEELEVLRREQLMVESLARKQREEEEEDRHPFKNSLILV